MNPDQITGLVLIVAFVSWLTGVAVFFTIAALAEKRRGWVEVEE